MVTTARGGLDPPAGLRGPAGVEGAGVRAAAGIATAGVNGTAGVNATAGVNGPAGVNLGGQRGGEHEDRGESTDDRKPDEHLSLSLDRRRTRQSAPCWLAAARVRA